MLTTLYTWLWQHTTGEPWTWIMRRNPLIFMPVLLFTAGLGAFATFLAGHVFWGERKTRRD